MAEVNDFYDRMEYLGVTKEFIRQAIVISGVEITDDDSFRQYANKIIEIGTSGEEDIPTWVARIQQVALEAKISADNAKDSEEKALVYKTAVEEMKAIIEDETEGFQAQLNAEKDARIAGDTGLDSRVTALETQFVKFKGNVKAIIKNIPSELASGDKFIIAKEDVCSTFVGHENQVATYNGSWNFEDPEERDCYNVVEIDKYVIWDGDEWDEYQGAAVYTKDEVDDLVAAAVLAEKTRAEEKEAGLLAQINMLSNRLAALENETQYGYEV